MTAVVIGGERALTLDHLVAVARDRWLVEVAPEGWARLARGRAVVDGAIARGEVAYGVTTGVGSQKDYVLDPGAQAAEGRRLLLAHATVIRSAAPRPEVARAARLIQLNGFCSGLCGVRPRLVEALVDELNRGGAPTVDLSGSVGASDLVPLAQAALSLLGADNPLEAGSAAGRSAEPLQLAAKEALSLMNSNAFGLARAALGLVEARRLLRGLDLATALSLEGIRGNPAAVDERVTAGQSRGHRRSAAAVRALLRGSKLLRPGEPRWLQDPLSFRCACQVNGAGREAWRWASEVVEGAIGAVADNPRVDLERGGLLSHGNMDATLPTVALDALRQALAVALGLSAERLHKLHWPAFSGLPSGLADRPGAQGGVQFLNLGHQAEAAALRVRLSAQPVALAYRAQLADGVEDHATALPASASLIESLLEAAWEVVTLELVVASWAVERRGLDPEALSRSLAPFQRALLALSGRGREGEEVLDLRPAVELVRAICARAPSSTSEVAGDEVACYDRGAAGEDGHTPERSLEPWHGRSRSFPRRFGRWRGRIHRCRHRRWSAQGSGR